MQNMALRVLLPLFFLPLILAECKYRDCLHECRSCGAPVVNLADCPSTGFACSALPSFSISSGPDCLSLHCSSPSALLFVSGQQKTDLVCHRRRWHFGDEGGDFIPSTETAVCGEPCGVNACPSTPLIEGYTPAIVAAPGAGNPCAKATCSGGASLFGVNGEEKRLVEGGVASCAEGGKWKDEEGHSFEAVACKGFKCPLPSLIDVAIPPTSYYLPVAVPSIVNDQFDCKTGQTLFVFQDGRAVESSDVECDETTKKWYDENAYIGDENLAQASCIVPRCVQPKVVSCTEGECPSPEVEPHLSTSGAAAALTCPTGKLFVQYQGRPAFTEVTLNGLNCQVNGLWRSSDADYEGGKISIFCSSYEMTGRCCLDDPPSSPSSPSFCPASTICSTASSSIKSSTACRTTGCQSPFATLFIRKNAWTTSSASSVNCDSSSTVPSYNLYNDSSSLGAYKTSWSVACGTPKCLACSEVVVAEAGGEPEGFQIDWTAGVERVRGEDGCLHWKCIGGSTDTTLVYFKLGGAGKTAKSLDCLSGGLWGSNGGETTIPSTDVITIFCGIRR